MAAGTLIGGTNFWVQAELVPLMSCSSKLLSFVDYLHFIKIQICLKAGELMKVGEDMSRWELLTMLLSLKALLESDNKDKALELINEVISEIKRNDKTE